jgi:CheY-like chemotaxis protein
MTSPDSTSGSLSVAARGGREAVISRELLDLALEDQAWQEGLDHLGELACALLQVPVAPWAASSEVKNGDTHEAEPDADEPMPPCLVWVLDDEPEVRRVIKRALQRAGNSVTELASGEETLQVVEATQDPPDLMISDVLLPGLTGPEVVSRIRESWPGLPVIFSSGFTRGELDRHNVSMDEAYFLPKPFDAGQLLEIVDRARRSGMGTPSTGSTQGNG